MHRAGLWLLLALASVYPQAAVAAQAADCKLKLVNTIPMTMAANGKRAFVPVIINGTKETFLLDTGGLFTQISMSTAQELKLPIGDTNVKLLDLYGKAASGLASVESFGLGRMQDKNTRLPISTFNGPSFVGLLAPDYMGSYDIELDFSGGKMNYFSPDHCEGKVVYWPAAAIAAVPMEFRRRVLDYHLIVSVMLDDHPVKAMIDTGATDSVLYSSAAKRMFGLTADSPGAKKLGEDGGDTAFEYVFKNLSFEGLSVGNPHIVVLPDRTGSKDPNNGLVTGTRLQKVDDPDPTDPVMLIGMNILSKLHLYIAFSENRIYMTPAAVPAEPVSAGGQ